MNEILEGNIFTHLSSESGCTNAKVNKLMKSIESERSHKSIVLLLVELAENHELSSDTLISLQYYLDMFEDLKEEPSFPETGVLLWNSAIIYGKRVDNIHFTVEKLLLSLINSETTSTARFAENQNINIPITKNGAKKGRKRTLDQLYKSYEIEMNIKRFRAISSNKRFEEDISCFCKKRNEKVRENEIKSSIVDWIKDYTHPQSWICSSVEDFDYEEEIDMKKNYKLITYHLEHRYNTLIPDLNFKIYFKIKDYIDAVYKDSTSTDLWPPLSDAYIQRFVNLENRILHIEGHNPHGRYEKAEINNSYQIPYQCQDDKKEVSIDFHSQIDRTTTIYLQENELSKTNKQENLSKTYKNFNENSSKAASVILQRSLSPFCDIKSYQPAPSHGKADDRDDTELQINNLTESGEDLHTIRVLLPHLDDEGVYFSDLNERDQQMLSPAVVATDVFRCIKDKTNIVVMIDDVIKRIYNIQEPKSKLLFLPILSRPEYSSISLNLLKIDHKYFKKRRSFKLGPDFHLLKQERLNKKNRSNRPRTVVRLCEDVAEVPISPISSPNYEPDFIGFPEDVFHDKNRTLSRDSGISLQMHENTLEQELNGDSKKRDCQLQFTKQCSNQKNNIDNLNQNENQFDLLAELNDKFIQSLSSVEYSCNEKYEVANSEHNSHINKHNTMMITETVTSVMAKVQQWHTYLQPLLMESKDRHHFDIFKLGTEILNHFEENNQHDKIISFQNVMENKDRSLVSRYFLSTLLLANQGNIGINIGSPNTEVPTELSNVGLKLLSKQRNAYYRESNSGAILSQRVKEQEKQGINITSTKIRTLKPVYVTSKTYDHDSGISMSDECSI